MDCDARLGPARDTGIDLLTRQKASVPTQMVGFGCNVNVQLADARAGASADPGCSGRSSLSTRRGIGVDFA
jgi:Tfp pilus assembly protein PilV